MNFILSSLAIAWKDLKVLFKDRGELATLFVMPLLFASIFGGANQLASSVGEPGSENAPVFETYVVNEDRGPYGAQVTTVLGGIKMLDLEALDSVDEADQRVADGEAPAAIVIPADFSHKVNTNQPARVRVIKDPTQEEEAGIVTAITNNAMAELSTRAEIEYGIRAVFEKTGVLDGADPKLVRAAEAQTFGAIWTVVQETRQNPLITVKSENLVGEETQGPSNPFHIFTPMFATMFAFFLVGTMASKMLEEKEQGSFRRLLAAPVHRGSVIAGKMLTYIVVVGLQFVVMFTVANVVFGMSLGETPLGLVPLTLAVALAATSLGMLVGALARNKKQAENIGMVLGFVLLAAGGFLPSAELAFRSEGFRFYLSQVTPHAHALDAYLKLMSEGAGVADVLPNMGILLGFAAVFFLVAMWRFRFEA